MPFRGFFMLLFVLTWGYSFSQPLHYNQYKNNPLHLNPALAGEEETPRFNARYRNQWPGLPRTREMYTLSGDAFIHSFQTGIGLYVNHAEDEGGMLSNTDFAALLSKKFSIGQNWSISPGIEVQYRRRKIDWNKMVFDGSCSGYEICLYNYTGPGRDKKKFQSVDFNTGVSIKEKQFYSGFVVKHLIQPYEYERYFQDRTPREYSLYFGYDFENVITKELSIKPFVLFRGHEYQNLFVVLTDIQYHWAFIGFGLAENFESRGPLYKAGYRGKNFSFSYSWDLSTPLFFDGPVSSHAITMAFRPWDNLKKGE